MDSVNLSSFSSVSCMSLTHLLLFSDRHYWLCGHQSVCEEDLLYGKNRLTSITSVEVTCDREQGRKLSTAESLPWNRFRKLRLSGFCISVLQCVSCDSSCGISYFRQDGGSLSLFFFSLSLFIHCVIFCWSLYYPSLPGVQFFCGLMNYTFADKCLQEKQIQS